MIENKQLNLQFEANLPVSQIVEKLWGQEIWVINTDNYCLKFMELKPQYHCSLHKHPIKTETFIVQQGEMLVEWQLPGEEGFSFWMMKPGDALTLPAGTWHVFSNQSTSELCQFIEISTHHEDGDVVRRKESGRVKSNPS